nr:MAG TPA: hypothetical protein [Caudoviricetes sp.]
MRIASLFRFFVCLFSKTPLRRNVTKILKIMSHFTEC